MPELTKINGSCHCKNIRFTLDWPANQKTIQVRQCGCTFCQKHAGAWTSNRDAVLGIAFEDKSDISKYGFGTQTADFYVCARCGVVPFVLSNIDDQLYAVVSVSAIDNADDFALSTAATDFSGEDTGSRLARRKKNWIPNVQFFDSGLR